MKRSIIVIALITAIGAGAGAYYMRRNGNGAGPAAPGGGGGRPGGFGGGFGFGGPRLPMTVELGAVKRADMAQRILVVGNLVGEATVEATPKVSGRLESVHVRLGDRVSRGQTLAKIEDSELLEQIKQAEASFEVANATIRQREADLRLAQTNLDRSRNLFERQLIPKQTMDDTDARYQAAVAQLDLARAQYSQAQARLDELKINLDSTRITSPVDGFVGSRTLDPGAWVTPNSAFLSLVDISVVRIIANVVERDLRRITQGLRAEVEVDAFPGEQFNGRVAHVAPILDPATRTAQIEIEIPNPQFRLKPGMYARVNFTVDQRENTLVVPSNAVVDLQGSRGVFQPDKGAQGDVARFKKIEVGLSDNDFVEVSSGLTEGERVVTTGAAALREGDRIVLLGQGAGGANASPGDAGRGNGASGGGSAPAGDRTRRGPAQGPGSDSRRHAAPGQS
jgi:membrane fusion protein (multidrug efflux system)